MPPRRLYAVFKPAQGVGVYHSTWDILEAHIWNTTGEEVWAKRVLSLDAADPYLQSQGFPFGGGYTTL